MVECPECNGSGSTARYYGDEEYAEPCLSCGGAGLVNENADATGDTTDLRLVPDIQHDERDAFGNESGAEAA